jgi:transcription elongation GreA/GreB family factor
MEITDAEGLRYTTYLQINDLLKQRLVDLEADLSAVQLSANQETKSSAGDKYETGRAMAQLEIEKLTARISDLKGQLGLLGRLEVATSTDVVSTGNLIVTTTELVYLSISIGPIEVMGKRILVVSPLSPLGKALVGKKVNEKVVFLNKPFTIVNIA